MPLVFPRWYHQGEPSSRGLARTRVLSTINVVVFPSSCRTILRVEQVGRSGFAASVTQFCSLNKTDEAGRSGASSYIREFHEVEAGNHHSPRSRERTSGTCFLGPQSTRFQLNYTHERSRPWPKNHIFGAGTTLPVYSKFIHTRSCNGQSVHKQHQEIEIPP